MKLRFLQETETFLSVEQLRDIPEKEGGMLLEVG
jgi:hypothetical protein